MKRSLTTIPRSRRLEFGVFPKPTGCGGMAWVVNPVTQKKRGRPTGARSPDASTIRTGGRFTNTAVPKFDGDGCWQQNLQIFNAIAKSNGWADEAAALQLFAHLEWGGGGEGSMWLAEKERILPCLPRSWRF